jgi:hypothetical protein
MAAASRLLRLRFQKIMSAAAGIARDRPDRPVAAAATLYLLASAGFLAFARWGL